MAETLDFTGFFDLPGTRKPVRYFREMVRQSETEDKMDKKYEMLALLIEDARAEQEKVERYDQLILLRCGNDAKAAQAADAELDHMYMPSRGRIRDALRMIRRITLDIERGL